ncbi:riboflavin transporter MCH5 [Fusarium tricinctum]|uniref:Riboflavin transporter MCH5 n=1 Tax=Fusarium tricinctum TaxID=61284 RepID=A0A8K0RS21_9HYPO|nr:riboflavin transporter MCH5 [Fusarium tricinctum]
MSIHQAHTKNENMNHRDNLWLNDHGSKEVESALPEETQRQGSLENSDDTSLKPPDGGLWAWLCVVGSHLAILNTWGVINSFGAFQSHYVQTLNRPPSDIAWIGSLEIFFLFFIGAFTGRLTDAGYFRYVAITGSALIVLGTMLASICTQYWQFILAQGVCVGLGNGCLFCPTIALVSTYFEKRRSLAIGVAASGSCTGGIVFPALVRQLLPRIGFGWTMRTIGFMQAGTMVIALVMLKSRLPPRRTGPMIDWVAFKELEYVFYAVGSFMCFWGTYFAFFFLATYARDIQGMSYAASLDLLMIINGIGFLGRLFPSRLADKYGAMNMYICWVAVCSLLIYAWAGVSSKAGLYVWTVVCGIALGGIPSLFPSGLASLTMDPSKQGSRIGMVFTVVSFGFLTGPSIEGALISALDGRYIAGQVFAGTSLAISLVFITTAREIKRRRTGLKVWVKI